MPEPKTQLTSAARDALESLRALLVVQEHIVSDRLSSVIAASEEGRESAGRALQGIVLDTLGEREDLEDIVWRWDALASGRAERARRHTDLTELLGSLLEVKRNAARRYARAAEAAPNPDLARRLRRLERQAAEHAAILLAMMG